MPWVPEGEGIRCLRPGANHGYFVPPASCPGCGADPAGVVYSDVDEPLAPPPEGCLSAEQLERWFVAIAGAALASVDTIEKPRPPARGKKKPRQRRLNFHDHAAIAKHRKNAIEAMRSAAELALRREDDELVRQREKRILERQRGASN
jgi:hypothetical protein